MKTFLRTNSSVKLPREILDLNAHINKLQEEYSKKGIELTQKEIAELLSVSEKQIEETIHAKQPTASLSESFYENSSDGDELSYIDAIEDPSLPVEEQIEKKMFSEEIRLIIDKLDDLDKEVIHLYFGIGSKQKNEREIAEKLNISRSYVSRIKRRAIKELEYLFSKTFDDSTKREYNIYNNVDKRTRSTKNEITDRFPGYSEQQILDTINTLSDLNKKIIELKFGLNGVKAISNKNITAVCGFNSDNITSGRICTILKQIEKKLASNTDFVNNSQTIKSSTKEIKQVSIKANDNIRVTKKAIESEKIQPVQPQIQEKPKEQTINVSKKELDMTVNFDFEKNKEQIKMLINMLNDSTGQVILLLRLGFINNKYYTENEIAKFLSIDEYEVHSMINKSLSNIVGISTLTIQRVENIRQQIDMTKNLKMNS